MDGDDLPPPCRVKHLDVVRPRAYVREPAA